MATKITLRGDTKANWVSVNPILSAREMVIETDTNRTKIGDGISTYTELSYSTSGVYPKTYKARLSQTGTYAPTAVVIENTLGNIVLSRTNSGQYKLTLLNGFPINTFITFSPQNQGAEYNFSVGRLNSSEITLYSSLTTISGDSFIFTDADELIEYGIIEIIVLDQ